MWKLLRRARSVLFVVFLVILTFYIFSLNYRRHYIDAIQNTFLTLTMPLFSAWTQVFRDVQQVFDRYINLVRTQEENELLRREVVRLENELLAYREAYIENQRLRRLLEFRDTLRWKSLAAVVVLNDLTGWFQTAVINRGRRDGVIENAPVVSDEGVVGQILNVGENFARVMLVTDPASAVDVFVQRNRLRGIVVGKDLQSCALKYVRNDADIRLGDLLVTSGKDGVFPEGLKVGVVGATYKDPIKMFQQVEVVPLAKLRAIGEVLVLLPSELIAPERVLP